MENDQIDYSDNPKITRELFATGKLKPGRLKPGKEAISLRVDADVLEWFRARGRGYQTEINALLRSYMEQRSQQH